jgi:hypothetical protein
VHVVVKSLVTNYNNYTTSFVPNSSKLTLLTG